MTTTAPAVESPTAASVALALADLLSLGLPDPCHVSVWPWAVHVASADVWFDGPDRLSALRAWAAHFGVTVDRADPDSRFARATFTRSGIRFECYADLAESAES